MKLTKFYKIIVALFLITGLGSCNKWLDLPPKDQITDDVLFSTKEGFLKALNGIYTTMNSNGLYGRELTMGMIDVLAQYWDISATDTDHSQRDYVNYRYNEVGVKAKFNTIWVEFYKLIANVNAILDRADGEVLPTQYYGMVKGEALGLRAMLHFDLLRMFGPIHSMDKNKESIPYISSSDRSTQPILSAEVVLKKVIADLEEAQKILSTSDPILTDGAQNFSGLENNHFTYRQYKMNYFAVTALLARAHLWAGDKEKALEYAKDVVTKGQAPGAEIFPFITLEEVKPTIERGVADRVFSREVLFAGYNPNRQSSFNSFFSARVVPANRLSYKGTPAEGRVQAMYEGENDYRKEAWKTAEVQEVDVMYWGKYDDPLGTDGSANRFRYMLPFIRISEMHLIIAECSQNLAEATNGVNQVRLHRGLPALQFSGLDEVRRAMEIELFKEVMGEGQLFYYYKRNAATAMRDGTRMQADGLFPVQLGVYVFPLPDSETSQRIDE